MFVGIVFVSTAVVLFYHVIATPGPISAGMILAATGLWSIGFIVIKECERKR